MGAGDGQISNVYSMTRYSVAGFPRFSSVATGICRHIIDHVINDEHNRIIIVVLAKHEIAP